MNNKEGWNPIPTNLRGNAFFGTKMHPDAALIMGDKRLVAIELDHGVVHHSDQGVQYASGE